jgi:hypothetical protein
VVRKNHLLARFEAASQGFCQHITILLRTRSDTADMLAWRYRRNCPLDRRFGFHFQPFRSGFFEYA